MNSFFEGKGFAGAVSLLAVGAVLWPVVENWRKEPRDGFPLSYYPMFSEKRRKKASVTYLVGIDAEGRRRMIRYDYAGAGGLNQVRRQINRIVRGGEAEDLVRIVGTNIARGKNADHAVISTVEVVTGKYNLEEYFVSRKKAPASETIHASMLVERGEDEPAT